MTDAATLASGKGHKDENFPVASHLIAPQFRAPVMAFYRFARAADDIADNAAASPDAKLAALDAMAAALAGAGEGEPTAVALRAALAERGLAATHPLRLLDAFRVDVVKHRYGSWDELIGYCEASAMPVGRFVLDVHGEDRALWPASDALCAALQIINHLQDCAEDYRALDRVYIPADMLAATGASVADLAAPRATPELGLVLHEMATRCQGLLVRSADFAGRIRDRRLGMEVAVIQRLAVSLAGRLRDGDPLARRIEHSKPEALLLAAGAALRRWTRR